MNDKFLYHYCAMRHEGNSTSYMTGIVTLSRKIKNDDDYSKFLDELSVEKGIERDSFAVVSLSLLHRNSET